jgi:hypothetical protein
MWRWLEAGTQQVARAGALASACAALTFAPEAKASSFDGRLYVGPSYMHNDTLVDASDSSGPALSLQLDAGLRVRAPWVLHATVIYDHSSWLKLRDSPGVHDGSMLGFGLGLRAHLAGLSLGVAAGGQFTNFPQSDDPASGPNGASLGPLLHLGAGYEWALPEDMALGAQLFARFRRSTDETVSIVYDPTGYQIGVAVSFGLNGEPLFRR